MQNKYRLSRKKTVKATNNKKKLMIILTAVLAVVVLTLGIVLIIQNTDKASPNVTPIIPKPACSDNTVYKDGIYSYMILDDGTIMISDCDTDKSITELNIPSELNGKKVTAIGNHAFSLMTWLRKLILPEGITYIGESAFSACGFDIVELPSTLMYIDNNAFAVCDYIKFTNYPKGVEEWKKVTVGSGNSSLTRNVTFD